MLIAVSSINGSPGVSSWSLMLAAAWPGPKTRVLVEADSSGGVLATRYGLSSDPGVIALVSQARLHPGERPEIQSYARRLDENLWCVPGPETAEGAGHIWNSGAGPLAECIAADDRLWLVDCGRIYPNTSLSPLLAASDVHLLFVGSSTESLVAVPSRVNWLAEHAATGVVSVGDSGRHPDEMLDFFGSERVWQVAHHRDLAKTAGQIFGSGRARRSKAWRTAVDISDNIARWIEQSGHATRSQTEPRLTAPLAVPTTSAAQPGRSPQMPGTEFLNPPKIQPAPQKSGWYEPLADTPGNDQPQAIRPGEAS